MMLKQVFTKIFRVADTGSTDTNNNNTTTTNNNNNNKFSSICNENNYGNRMNDSNRYNQAPIYAIPTISSCFQSNNNPPNLTSYYNNNNNNNSNNNNNNTNNNYDNDSKTSNTNYKSVSSLSSPSSTTSCSSLSNSFGMNNNNNNQNNKPNNNNNNRNLSNSKTDLAKYNDLNTRQIYIAPHCIRYSNSTLDDTIYRIDDDSLNEIAAEILESDNLPPKLQIVYYDGNYFAINNSNLQIYKQLQLSGLITHVQADLISVEAIPYALRQHLLQTPSQLANSNEITDEECSESYESNLNRNGAGSSSSGVSIGANVDSASGSDSIDGDQPVADIIIPSSILDKDILVDETYEFGVCENCLESDNEEENEEDDEEEDIEDDEDADDSDEHFTAIKQRTEQNDKKDESIYEHENNNNNNKKINRFSDKNLNIENLKWNKSKSQKENQKSKSSCQNQIKKPTTTSNNTYSSSSSSNNNNNNNDSISTKTKKKLNEMKSNYEEDVFNYLKENEEWNESEKLCANNINTDLDDIENNRLNNKKSQTTSSAKTISRRQLDLMLENANKKNHLKDESTELLQSLLNVNNSEHEPQSTSKESKY